MTRTRSVLAAVVVLALAGCGDGDTSETSNTDAPPTSATSTLAPDTTDTTAPVATGADTSGSTVPDRAERPEPTQLPEPLPTDLIEPRPAVVGEVPADLLSPVLADASDRSGIDVGDISVLRSQEVQWSDGSLGCPEPGQVYTMAVVPGYWVVFDAGGQVLDYRLDTKGFFVLCESPVTTYPEGPPTS